MIISINGPTERLSIESSETQHAKSDLIKYLESLLEGKYTLELLCEL